MLNNSCYLCGSNEIGLVHKGVRDNKDIDVLKCKDCGLHFLSSFDHIHNGFYENSGMHTEKKLEFLKWRADTKGDDLRRAEYLKDIIKDRSILDFGCGNGGFLEYSRRYANEVYGVELEKAARLELLTEDFTVWEGIEQGGKKFDIITLFHVIEHLENPVEYLLKLKEYLHPQSESQIILETPNSDDALLSLYQSDAFADFTYWSPHLYLYNNDNLIALANKAGLKVNWIRQIQRYPLSNHLYWLSKGRPGGQKEWDFLDDQELNERYYDRLKKQKMCDTLLISIS